MPPEPLILGFDTSAAHCAVALVCGDEVLAQRQEDMHKGQAERLFLLLEEIIEEANVRWSDFDAIGVGTGPGNFTGVRLSVSAARGLALSLKRPAIGINVFDAMAFGHDGLVLATLDARREQTYAQLVGLSEPLPPQMLAFDDLQDFATMRPDICVGHRADEAAQKLGAKMREATMPVAEAIARLAASRMATPQPRPAPLYLRSADAAPSSEPPPVILS